MIATTTQSRPKASTVIDNSVVRKVLHSHDLMPVIKRAVEDAALKDFSRAVMAYDKDRMPVGKAARKLDNALSALSTLSPSERLGFLVMATGAIAGLAKSEE